MDWRSVTFDWNRARAFLVTAEEGSLSAAARAMGLTQPTLGRQVAALEKELGIVLFERVGRRLVLTPGGLELADHVRTMGEAASRFKLIAAGQSQSIKGPVCISASEVVAAFLLPPIIAGLRRETPGIRIEIVASNAPSNLLRHEADIAIRSFRPTQPDLIAKKLPDMPIRLYATKCYLERIGTPESPEDLAKADFIGFDETNRLIAFFNVHGLSLTSANFPVLSMSQLVQWEMVKAGAGIAGMPQRIGDAESSVMRVLPSMKPMFVPMWLVSHRGLNTSRRVRMVFDILARSLAR